MTNLITGDSLDNIIRQLMVKYQNATNVILDIDTQTCEITARIITDETVIRLTGDKSPLLARLISEARSEGGESADADTGEQQEE